MPKNKKFLPVRNVAVAEDANSYFVSKAAVAIAVDHSSLSCRSTVADRTDNYKPAARIDHFAEPAPVDHYTVHLATATAAGARTGTFLKKITNFHLATMGFHNFYAMSGCN